MSFWASWRYAVWSSRLTDPRCHSEILSFQYWTSSGHSVEYFSLRSLLINFSQASCMPSTFFFSILLPGVLPPGLSVLWHLSPSFSSCDAHPPQKNPGLPKSNFQREDSFFLGFFGRDSLSQFSSSSRNLCTTSSPTRQVALS